MICLLLRACPVIAINKWVDLVHCKKEQSHLVVQEDGVAIQNLMLPKMIEPLEPGRP